MGKKAPAVTGLVLAGIIILYFLSPGSFKLPGSDASPAIAGNPAATVEAAESTIAAEDVKTGSAEITDETVSEAADETTAAEAADKTTATEASDNTAIPDKPIAGEAGTRTEPKDSPIKPTDIEGIVPGGTITARVKRAVDGDTLVAVYKNKDYRVRLLCIDTPESVMTGVKVQAYGKEASEKLKELVQGKDVRLVFEKDTDDRYDRLLAYVILDDGSCVNSILVSEGYARVEFVKPNTVNKEYFTGLMEYAISQGRGSWSLPEDERPFVKDKDGGYYPRYYDEEKAA